MKYGGLEHVSWPQYRAAMCDLTISGDDAALEDLGYVRSAEILAEQARRAAKVAELLGIDMRTPAERRRQEALDYYAEEFFLNGSAPLDEAQIERNDQGLALARAALEHRHDPSS